MKKWVELAYDICDEVYLKTDKEQNKRLVVSVWLMQTGIKYELQQGTFTSWHYDFEISKVPDLKLKTSVE